MKNFKVSVFFLFMSFFNLFFAGCATFEKKDCPYEIGGMVMENSGIRMDDEWDGNIKFSFENKTDKKIESFDVVLSLYDWNGEPVFENDFISFYVEEDAAPWEKVDGAISIREYVESEGNMLWTDYFYVSTIRYEDGSVWEDPLGRYAL